MAHLRIIFLIVVLVFATAGMAYAASALGTLAVSAIIPLNNGNCSVQSTQNISFGALDPLSPPPVVTASGSVTYKCTGLGNKGATINVTLATPTPLTLKRTTLPANPIPYIVDLPVAAFIPPNGSGSVTIPITAEIYGSDYQLAPAGTYTDTITVQLTP